MYHITFADAGDLADGEGKPVVRIGQQLFQLPVAL